jgi:hypothetical protein
MHDFDEDNRTDDEPAFSESTKVELLKLVMTGKIKRPDYLKAIKE